MPLGRSSYSRPAELALYAISPLATLISAPILARNLGPEDRGLFGVAAAVVAFALTIGAWGQAEVHFSEARLGRASYGVQREIAAIGGVVTSVVAFAAMIALGVPLVVALVAAAFVPFLNQASLWRSVSITSQQLGPPALGSALGPLLRVVLLVVLAAAGSLNLVTATVATEFALALAAAVTTGLVARSVGRATAARRDFRRGLLSAGALVIVFDVLNAILLRSDIIILQIISSSEQVGYYAAPASLTTASFAVSIAFKSRIQAEVASNRRRFIIVREFVIVLLLALIGAVSLVVLAPWLVLLLFGSEFRSSIVVLQILAAGLPFFLAYDLVQGYLIARGRRRALVTMGVIGAAAILLCLFALTPMFGAVGAAIALVVVYGCLAAIGVLSQWKDLRA